jgi:hypothetical protein
MITVNSEQLILVAEDRRFIDLVNNRITVYGQIPYKVPENLIIDIIKESARYFYRHYYKATYKTFYRLSKYDVLDYLQINDDLHIADYSIVLPSYVNVVWEVYESDKINVPTSQQLIENVQLLQRSAPYGQSILGINNSLYIIEAACRLVEEANYNSIFSTSVPFHYNNLVHTLSIHKTMEYHMMLEILANVNVQVLYNDDLFIRHVIARVKQELKRVLAGHTIELPGGVTLNADEICNNLEDVEKVEEILKNSGGIGDIIMIR